jgi:hypothetical protein
VKRFPSLVLPYFCYNASRSEEWTANTWRYNALVCGVQNIGVVQDLADALFPQSNGYGVARKSLEYW